MTTLTTRTTLLSLWLLMPLAAASSQTIIGGNIWDGSGGPLLAGNVYHATTSIGVPAGQTLTIEAGAVVKFTWQAQLSAAGTLICNGTPGSPVVFTTVNDDVYGGDSNGNGPSVGGAGEWRSVFLNGATGSTLDNVIVRFGGGAAGTYPNVDMVNSDAVLTDCTIENSLGFGFNMQNSSSIPTVTGCSIINNANNAVYNATLPGLQGFSNNTVTGNGGNFAHVFSGTGLTTNVALGPDNLPGGAVVVSNHVGVNPTGSLTFEAGSIVKIIGSFSANLSGLLFCNGTAADPVVFTTYADDEHGGDTNNDGPSNGAPSSWRGLSFDSNSSGSVLTHTIVRYTGTFSSAAVSLAAADITLDKCILSDGGKHGLYLAGNTYGATVRDCTFSDNGLDAIYYVPIEALPGFSNNTASGNGRDIIHVFGDNNVDADLTIGPENLLNGVLISSNHIGVSSSATLRIEAGVIIKMVASFQLDAPGGLELLGTALRPIVVTSFEDDAWGGDSNADGAATTPAKSDWRGISLTSASKNSKLENVLIRYGGASFYRGVYSTSPLATLRAVRVEHHGFTGFDIQAHTIGAQGEGPTNLVAFDCNGNGFEMLAGNFPYWHCTASASGGVGMAKIPAWTGAVHNSISWGNGGTNYDGFALGDLYASNGHPTLDGIQGNWNVDPLFVDPSINVGDLHLSPGSICANTGAVPQGHATVKDHDEYSRILEYGNNGLLLPDMGAYELADWSLAVTGDAIMGSTLGFDITGPGNSQALYSIGFLDGEVYISPYGYLLTGYIGAVYVGFLPVSQTLSLEIPASLTLEGLKFGVQAGVFSSVDPTHRSITNLYRGRIRE